MHSPHTRAAVQLGRSLIHHASHDTTDPAITAWQALLDAGHFGNPAPAPPIAARREAVAAQFAAYRDDAGRVARAR